MERSEPANTNIPWNNSRTHQLLTHGARRCLLNLWKIQAGEDRGQRSRACFCREARSFGCSAERRSRSSFTRATERVYVSQVQPSDLPPIKITHMSVMREITDLAPFGSVCALNCSRLPTSDSSAPSPLPGSVLPGGGSLSGTSSSTGTLTRSARIHGWMEESSPPIKQPHTDLEVRAAPISSHIGKRKTLPDPDIRNILNNFSGMLKVFFIK